MGSAFLHTAGVVDKWGLRVYIIKVKVEAAVLPKQE